MKNVLYLGNYLSKKQRNPTYMQSLGRALMDEGYSLRFSSSKDSKLFRMMDMAFSLFNNAQWADVVLIDTYSTLNFYYALICSQICKILNLKYICILHGGNLPDRLNNSQFFSNLIFKNSYFNVAPSPYFLKVFREQGYANVIHIPNGIAIIDYKFTERIFDRPKLLWVRSFSKIYNPQMAVKVLDELLKRGYDAELCMVGPEADESLENTKQLINSIKLEVKLTGKLSKSQWKELSGRYNVFINTTNYDNTPVSVIEAMALGLPIVSTNVGGMPYLIENNENGLLVNPRNSQEMADAIELLFINKNFRNSIISMARIKAIQFDWNIVKEKWNNILRD